MQRRKQSATCLDKRCNSPFHIVLDGNKPARGAFEALITAGTFITTIPLHYVPRPANSCLLNFALPFLPCQLTKAQDIKSGLKQQQ